MNESLRSFNVLLYRKADVERSLIALAKRAARKRLVPLTWTWGKPYTSKETIPHPEFGWQVECKGDVTRIPLDIAGETPKYAGWRFLAALQHLEGVNIVRAVPGETVPLAFRARGPRCDHCNMQRRRNDTFVLAHDDGRTIQVGSSCMGDFLGRDDAGSIAAQASMLAEVRSIAEEGSEGSGSDNGADRTLAEYLPYVSWCVRERGWMSRTKARDEGKGATADFAWTFLTDAKERMKAGVELTDEDRATAEHAETWGESITDETIDAETGDYLHNLRAVARSGLTTYRTCGIAASMVTAWQRAVGRERLKAERNARPTLDAHVGSEGAKISFGLPAKVGKRGKALKGAPIVVRDTPVTLDFVTGYDTDYGYTTICKFRTDDGATLVWKASSTSLAREDVGKRYTLVGTVKKHDEYKGAKQTVLTRCDATEVTG